MDKECGFHVASRKETISVQLSTQMFSQQKTAFILIIPLFYSLFLFNCFCWHNHYSGIKKYCMAACYSLIWRVKARSWREEEGEYLPQAMVCIIYCLGREGWWGEGSCLNETSPPSAAPAAAAGWS